MKLSEGENIVDAAKFASYASALKITRKGAAVAIPTLKEVEEFIALRNATK